MKVYISVDIEGVAGICDWKETELGDSSYAPFQIQMTKETASCIEGLKAAGVEEIYVRDAHDSARNLILSELPKGIKIIRGWENHPCDMLAGLDESFDACLFIGYHSPARSKENPLSHTMNLGHNHLLLNGKPMSEFHINAYYANSLNVPVIMVSGDRGLCDLVKQENQEILTVSTKEGLHGAVISKHPDDVCEEIKAATIEAVNKLKKESNNKPKFFLSLEKPVEAEIFFRKTKQAHLASFYPGTRIVKDDIVTYTGKDIWDVLTFLLFTDK